jgi:hypothetical protein
MFSPCLNSKGTIVQQHKEHLTNALDKIQAHIWEMHGNIGNNIGTLDKIQEHIWEMHENMGNNIGTLFQCI